MQWNSIAARWLRKFTRPTRPLQGRAPRRGVRLRLEPLETRWMPSIITVTSVSNSGTGSLRTAINSANLSEPNTIQFNITGSTTIDLTSALPNITKNVFIDGASQGGTGYSGPPLIVLNGAGITGSANGLDFASGSRRQRGAGPGDPEVRRRRHPD